MTNGHTAQVMPSILRVTLFVRAWLTVETTVIVRATVSIVEKIGNLFMIIFLYSVQKLWCRLKVSCKQWADKFWKYIENYCHEDHDCGEYQNCQVQPSDSHPAFHGIAFFFLLEVKEISQTDSDYRYRDENVTILHGVHHECAAPNSKQNHDQR